MNFRHIAPAGTKIKLSEFFGWAVDLLLQRDRTETFKQAIQDRYQVKYCFLMSSARAALAMLFQMLKERTENKQKNTIILPAYTCYSLPAAAEIAGLKVSFCDIDPKTLSYDLQALEKMDFDKVLAIVSASLYGVPDDLEALERIAQQNDIVFIDDAAQAMHAQWNSQYAGTFGDIGVYSLDKGKNITSIQGGIIVTNDDALAQQIAARVNDLIIPPMGHKLSEMIKLAVYFILLRPWLYWIPASLPGLGLGKTIYTTDYYFSQYSTHLASLSLRLFQRIDEITAKRCDNLAQLKLALSSCSGIDFIENTESARSACLRLSMIFESESTRDRVLQALQNNGIGASISYPKSLPELSEVADFHNNKTDVFNHAQYIAGHILTLPTTEFLTQKDMKKIKEIFNMHL